MNKLFITVILLCVWSNHILPNTLASVVSSSSKEAKLLGSDNDDDDDKDQVCYNELGCFNKSESSSDWIIPSVVTSLFPDSPENISPTFYAFSCSKSQNPAVFAYNENSTEISQKLNAKGFDSKKRTFFIAHGYREEFSQTTWMGDIKDLILSKAPCQYNVIAVDWHNGSQVVNYFQAVANTKVAGAAIALIMQKIGQIYSENVTPDSFTIIGHSLGAHVAGFAGKRYQEIANGEKVRNIIALDAAGPAFSAVSPASRLDLTDAKLVLTIHTMGGPGPVDGLGIADPLGHYNFYPNGGEKQPGCEAVKSVSNVLLDGPLSGVWNTITCSHHRSWELVSYNETYLTDCQSVGYSCDSYEAFENGECGQCEEDSDQCAPFGLWFSYWQELDGPSQNWSKPIRYYFDTEQSLPYCLFHYQVTALTEDNFTSIDGQLELTLNGRMRDDYTGTVKLEDSFKPEQQYSVLYKVRKNLGPIGNVIVNWQPTLLDNIGDSIGISDSNRLQITEIRTRYMSSWNVTKRENFSTKLTNDTSNTEMDGSTFS